MAVTKKHIHTKNHRSDPCVVGVVDARSPTFGAATEPLIRLAIITDASVSDGKIIYNVGSGKTADRGTIALVDMTKEETRALIAYLSRQLAEMEDG